MNSSKHGSIDLHESVLEAARAVTDQQRARELRRLAQLDARAPQRSIDSVDTTGSDAGTEDVGTAGATTGG